jgi:alkaline phosphatase D
MYKRTKMKFLIASILVVFLFACKSVNEHVPARQIVTLKEAHIGSLEMDTKLLDSYEPLPENLRQFYIDTRFVFANDSVADFTHPEILKAAEKYGIPLIGGPMLGQLRDDGVTLWLRPSSKDSLTVKVKKSTDREPKKFIISDNVPGVEQRIKLDGLLANTHYQYGVYANNNQIAEGAFTTAPPMDNKGLFSLAFGSCSHKIGLHNPNIINQIMKRDPDIMLLLGDIAVDDRLNNISMHKADYALRDISKPWRYLAANTPIYAMWDDHDYFDNDLGGIPEGFKAGDRDTVRNVWQQNWNNPQTQSEGIYFNTRIGPIEVIMLDTRSFREIDRRGGYASFLGSVQLGWLKDTLSNSTAPFKIITSGTMWSDDISNGKDSWGTWDTVAREELFTLIEAERISGVLLISGDRHGARGFTISRPSGYKLHEFQVSTLSGVEGPEAIAKNPTNQLFGHIGKDTIAFGEFIFNTQKEEALVTFRLIDETGNIMEEHVLPYSQLIPNELVN